MEESNKKLIIGFITYGKATAKYLPYFLSSLKQQTFQDFKIIAIDNSEAGEDENIFFIKNDYPEVEIERAADNLGFAKANNRLMDKAIQLNAEYFLMINPDTVLEPETVERMMGVIASDERLGAVCPKVLHWEFDSDKKTDIIDTLGIKLLPGLRFVDLGQGLVDDGHLEAEMIFGPSGTAGLFRLTALQQIAVNGQYFDETMFMYKEDCDLAYRLNLANIKVKLVSEAIVYHDRTVPAHGESNLAIALNRKNKSRQVKEWSGKNQLIIYYKYWLIQDFKNKRIIIWQLIKMVGFAILFEQYLLKIFFNWGRIKSEIHRYKFV